MKEFASEVVDRYSLCRFRGIRVCGAFYKLKVVLTGGGQRPHDHGPDYFSVAVLTVTVAVSVTV